MISAYWLLAIIPGLWLVLAGLAFAVLMLVDRLISREFRKFDRLG